MRARRLTIVLLSILLIIRVGLVRFNRIGCAVVTRVSGRHSRHLRHIRVVLDRVGVFDRVDDRRRFRDPITVGLQVVVVFHDLYNRIKAVDEEENGYAKSE